MRILFLLLISVAAMGQVKIKEPQPSEVEIQYSHEKNSFKKKIFGKIEVDGHIVSDSVKFYAWQDVFGGMNHLSFYNHALTQEEVDALLN